jgi:hypothetical protein
MTLDNRGDFQVMSQKSEFYPSNDLVANARVTQSVGNNSILRLLITLYQETKFREHLDYLVPVSTL